MKFSVLRFVLFCLAAVFITGCAAGNDSGSGLSRLIQSTDASIMEHHVQRSLVDLHDFIDRLYARNPKYEQDLQRRRAKVGCIFQKGVCSRLDEYDKWTSNQFLTAAFEQEEEGDRVYLLGLGLTKSLQEAYGLKEIGFFWTGLQISLERLQRLYFNLSQVNWRLKTYRDEKGDLLFLTNGMSENGYLNMGYEVIMTRILTRIEDDIFLRGGLPQMYMFKVPTFFLSILM